MPVRYYRSGHVSIHYTLDAKCMSTGTTVCAYVEGMMFYKCLPGAQYNFSRMPAMVTVYDEK